MPFKIFIHDLVLICLKKLFSVRMPKNTFWHSHDSSSEISCSYQVTHHVKLPSNSLWAKSWLISLDGFAKDCKFGKPNRNHFFVNKLVFL